MSIARTGISRTGLAGEKSSAAPSGLTVAIAEASLVVGDTATASVSVSGNPAPTLAYQWTLDGVDIGGATGAAYVTTAAGALRVRVTATNSEGVAGPVTSAPVTIAKAALAPVVVEAALTAGSWGGVDLLDVSQVSGDTSFTTAGVTPTGLALHTQTGLLHGVPSAAGTSSTVYQCAGDAETQQVTVNWTISPAAPAYDRVTALNGLSLTGQGDGDPSNTLTTNTGQMTLAGRLYMPSASVSTLNLFENSGRSTFVIFSSGTLVVTLKGVGNVSLASYGVTDFDGMFSGGMSDFVLSIDTSQAVEADRIKLWVNGAPQSIFVGGGGALALNAVLDVTRSTNTWLAAFPADWEAEWLYASFGEALTPADFASGPAAAGSPEILVAGSLADWNAGVNIGTGANLTPVAAFTLVSAGVAGDATPRYSPAAVGYGRYTVGGRSAAVIDVTVASEAAMRDAVSAATLAGGAYVRVLAEGEIYLAAALDLTSPNTTWDFRFAPGLGVWFTGSRVRAAASGCHVIGLLSVPGSRRRGQVYESRDAITIGSDGTTIDGVVLERSAALWSTDECFSTWPSGATAVLQNCTVDGLLCAEALAFPREDVSGGDEYRTGHPKQWLVGGNTRQTTFTRSASLSGFERNFLATPFGATSQTDYEFVGNVVGNWGLQGTQISKNSAGAAHKARVESVIFLAGNIGGSGTMTSLHSTREMIFLDPDYADGDVYFNDIALWLVDAAGAIAVDPLDPAPVNGVSAIAQVRATTPSTTKYGSAFWSSEANLPAASDAPRPALTDAYDVVRNRVGPRLRNGNAHPLVQRIIKYGLPERTDLAALAARPFLPENGYRGANYKGAIDELVHLGVTVTPSAGTLAVTVQATSLPPAVGHPWQEIIVQATPCTNKVDETGWSATTKEKIDQLRPAGHAALPSDMYCSTVSPGDDSVAVDWTAPVLIGVLSEIGGMATKGGLAPGTWVIRIGWRTATTTVWVESGILWSV